MKIGKTILLSTLVLITLSVATVLAKDNSIIDELQKQKNGGVVNVYQSPVIKHSAPKQNYLVFQSINGKPDSNTKIV